MADETGNKGRRRVTIVGGDGAAGAAISSTADDIAYIAPMAAFLAFTWLGTQWRELYPLTYTLKTLLVAAMLVYFRRRYTPICWTSLWLGAVVGAVVVVQWVGMELFILKHWPNYPRMSRGVDYVPFEHFHSPAAAWGFIAIRWAGASLLVPFMEELFWRDFLWRSVSAPDDFKRVEVGRWNALAFVVVAVAFGAGVHIEWITAIVCGLIYGLLLVKTRSLGACIIAHGVTNFLLGLYVVVTHDWRFW